MSLSAPLPAARRHGPPSPTRLPVAGIAAALSACLILGGCAGQRPYAYAGVASTTQMRATDHGSDRVPYAYATAVNWREYSRILIEPVTIYRGDDAQFGKIPEEGRVGLASYMDQQFAETLSPPFELVDRPAPRTLRLRLTLTGAKATMPVAGAFSRIDLAGGPYNMVQAIRGREGSLTGSVFYAVEIYDATTDRLLLAQIVKQYPAALNVKATFGALTAAKTGIRNGAEDLADVLAGTVHPDPAAYVPGPPVYDPLARRSPPRLRTTTIADDPAPYPPCRDGQRDRCRQRTTR